MSVKTKVFDILGRYVPILKGKSSSTKDVYLYGVNNLLPNDNLRDINNSGAAKRAISKLTSYIEADGFSDDTSAAFKINPTQTADQILSEIASYVAYNKGFALFIERDMLSGVIKSSESACFECIRKTINGDFTYNPLLGQADFKESETKMHPNFFGLVANPEQLKLIANPKTTDAKGKEVDNPYYKNREIYYVYKRTADSPHYPVPEYVAGIEDIKTAAELQMLDYESAKNAFMPSSILITGEMDTETLQKDSEGKNIRGTSEADVFEESLKSFTGQKKNEYGESGRMRLMWIQVKSMDEAPKLEKYDAKAIIEASINKRDQVERAVSRWIGVHPVLIGYSDAAVLGNTQAIANASKDLTDFVNPLQRMISDAFKVLYPLMDWTLSQYAFWIPEDLMAVLTDDEKRELIGYEPKPKEGLAVPDGMAKPEVPPNGQQKPPNGVPKPNPIPA